MSVINILAPVFLLVGLGTFLKHYDFFGKDFFDNCAKFTYWIALPALLIHKISYSKFNLADSWKISAVMIIASIGIAFSAYLLASFMKVEKDLKKTFIQTSFHCNTAFVGLPVIMYTFSNSMTSPALTDAASMALAPMIPAINIMSITVMWAGESDKRQDMWRDFLKKILINPLVLSCVTGIIMFLFDIHFPVAFDRGLTAIGSVALPLALLSVGSSLQFSNIKENLAMAVIAAISNVVALPLLGLLVGTLFNLTHGEMLVVLIFLACPTASSAYIYARQLKGNAAFAGRVIVISTIISALSLWTVLILM